MTNTTVATADLAAVLASYGDDYLPAYEAIVKAADDAARSSKVTNRKARVEAFKNAVAKRDRGQLAKANKLFTGYLRKVRANAELSENMDEPRELTVPEARSLMDEFIDIKTAKDTLTAREEEIKRLTFDHLNEQFAKQGEESPHLVNGSIDVPELGYRFSREGAGRKDPKLNEKALAALVGPEVWAKISTRETVVVEKVDIGALMAEATRNPKLLADLEGSLQVGDETLGRLNLRAL